MFDHSLDRHVDVQDVFREVVSLSTEPAQHRLLKCILVALHPSRVTSHAQPWTDDDFDRFRRQLFQLMQTRRIDPSKQFHNVITQQFHQFVWNVVLDI